MTLFDILRHISEYKDFAHHLLSNLDFITLVARNFETSPASVADLQLEGESSLQKAAHALEVKKLNYLVKIIETIWGYEKEDNVKVFSEGFRKCLNRDGLLLFFLNALFNKHQPLEIRVSIAKLLREFVK